MYSGLQGKKVAVTGAAGSFGTVFVEDLLKQGCIVYAIARTKSKLDALIKSHPTVIPILCDLTKWGETEKLLTEKLPADLDMLVNNAAVAKPQTLEELTEEAVDELVNVNIKGTLCITKIVTKKMIANGKGGSIVNISSLAADFPCAFLLAYGMTKAGINRLTKTLATQLGPSKIRVNCINPTVIPDTNLGDEAFDTEEKLSLIKTLTPLKPLPTVKDVSDAVLFFLSDQAKSITGQIMFVDSGLRGG